MSLSVVQLQRHTHFPLRVPCGTLLLFAAAFFLTALPAYSQQAQLDALAARTAQTLEKAYAKNVVVSDFWTPDKKVTKLGDLVADQFSAELGGQGRKFRMVDRERLRKSLSDFDLSSLVLVDLEIAKWIAKRVGAKAIVVGEIGREGEQFHLTVSIFETSNGQNLGNYGITLPGAVDWNTLFDSPLIGEEAIQAPEAGEKGYSVPTCLYCPLPVYPDTAFTHKTQGAVVLDCIVTANGRASNINVKDGLPSGLTVAVIKAVQN